MRSHAEPALVHALKNQLTIILGFADLIIADAAVPPQCALDAREIKKAARAAVAILIPSESVCVDTEATS